MTGSLRSSLNTGLNNGLRQSISGGVNGLGFFRTASLDLQFASKKTLDDRVSGSNLITFTRASSATYVDSAGLIQTATTDTPRFDHDPATGESLGLLIEEARTNLITNSLCSTANWTIPGLVVTDNAGTAPDGTTTATFITPNTGNSTITSPLRNLPSARSWTNSVFVKPDGVTTFDLKVINYADTSNQTVTFDTTQSGVNGAGITPSGSNTANYLSARMEHYPNGWVKLSISVNVVGPDLNGVWQLAYSGDAASSFYVWHWQTEDGSYPTSLIPTSGTTVTRAADVAEITSTNFSSWYNQTEGTLTFDYTPLGVIENKSIWGILGTSANNRLLVYADPSRVHTFYSDNGGLSSVTLPTPTVGVRTRGAYAFSQSDISAAVDGVAAGTTADTIATTMNKLEIGHSSTYNTSPSISAHIKRLAYFNTRLPDATLQSITS